MSILSSGTSILELKIPGEDKPTRPSDDCQPQKDYCDPKPSDDCGKGDTHKLGDALAKFDFSHGDFGSHGPDQTSDLHGALASMSSDDALEYAIGQMGPADHFDAGHFDVPTDTSHDTDA